MFVDYLFTTFWLCFAGGYLIVLFGALFVWVVWFFVFLLIIVFLLVTVCGLPYFVLVCCGCLALFCFTLMFGCYLVWLYWFDLVTCSSFCFLVACLLLCLFGVILLSF